MKLKIFLGSLLIATAIIGYLFFAGNPRMKVQAIIKPYQASMPLPPENSIPVEDAFAPLPSPQQAEALGNPLSANATAADIQRGKVYYEYYCISCHGPDGVSPGLVGQSIFPYPADLRTSTTVRAYSDGQLLRAMLTGPGHTPHVTAADVSAGRTPASLPAVLNYTVNPEHRWYLVLYVRSLAEPRR